MDQKHRKIEAELSKTLSDVEKRLQEATQESEKVNFTLQAAIKDFERVDASCMVLTKQAKSMQSENQRLMQELRNHETSISQLHTTLFSLEDKKKEEFKYHLKIVREGINKVNSYRDVYDPLNSLKIKEPTPSLNDENSVTLDTVTMVED